MLGRPASLGAGQLPHQEQVGVLRSGTGTGGSTRGTVRTTSTGGAHLHPQHTTSYGEDWANMLKREVTSADSVVRHNSSSELANRLSSSGRQMAFVGSEETKSDNADNFDKHGIIREDTIGFPVLRNANSKYVNEPVTQPSESDQKEGPTPNAVQGGSDVVVGGEPGVAGLSTGGVEASLHIQISAASNLASNDMQGSDPYCKLYLCEVDRDIPYGAGFKIEGCRMLYKCRTQPIPHTCDPVWNFSIPEPIPILFDFFSSKRLDLVVVVFDKDRFSSDDFLGEVTLTLGEDVPENQEFTRWFPLHCRPGYNPTFEIKGHLKMTLNWKVEPYDLWQASDGKVLPVKGPLNLNSNEAGSLNRSTSFARNDAPRTGSTGPASSFMGAGGWSGLLDASTDDSKQQRSEVQPHARATSSIPALHSSTSASGEIAGTTTTTNMTIPRIQSADLHARSRSQPVAPFPDSTTNPTTDSIHSRTTTGSTAGYTVPSVASPAHTYRVSMPDGQGVSSPQNGSTFNDGPEEVVGTLMSPVITSSTIDHHFQPKPMSTNNQVSLSDIPTFTHSTLTSGGTLRLAPSIQLQPPRVNAHPTTQQTQRASTQTSRENQYRNQGIVELPPVVSPDTFSQPLFGVTSQGVSRPRE